MAKLSKTKIEAYKAQLQALQKDLTHLTESSAEGRKPVELDQTTVGRLSRMDAMQAQAMALETGRRRQIELKRVGAALARIEEGEYGYCLTCGEEVEKKRLQFDPTTPNCINCAV